MPTIRRTDEREPEEIATGWVACRGCGRLVPHGTTRVRVYTGPGSGDWHLSCHERHR